MPSNWLEIAQEKRRKENDKIPVAWRIPPPAHAGMFNPLWLSGNDNDLHPDVDAEGNQYTTNVSKQVKNHQLLSDLERQITEIENVQELVAKLHSREWSAVQVTTAFCKRAALAHQYTNCLSTILFDDALKRAAMLDEQEVVGPLHGVPISIKEQFEIEGLPGGMGFTSHLEPASATCKLVKALESLGAIVHCRTNIPQGLLMDETISWSGGRVLNPWNVSLTPAGSSGGEGALVALKGSILGIGTDLGGSIRKPSSFCSLYSLRPSPHLVPYGGASNIFSGAESISPSAGPMARSLATIKYFIQILIQAKVWQHDQGIVERVWPGPLLKDQKKLVFAFMWNDGLARPHPPIERCMKEMSENLISAGHHVVDWEPVAHSEAQEIIGRIWDSDGGEDLSFWAHDEKIFPQAFKSQFPALSVYESWALNKKRNAYRQLFLDQLKKLKEGGEDIDAIVCPVAPHLAEKHLSVPRNGGLISYTTIWSLLDLPCGTVPVGWIDEEKDSIVPEHTPMNEFDKENWNQFSVERYKNAPVVLQLVISRKNREDLWLRSAREFDDALKKCV